MGHTITVLDGGMGRELMRIGAPFHQPEWSALALMEASDRVLEAHRNFVAAGAEVITVSSYAVVPFHIGAERFAGRGRELVELAARIAREAADEADRPVRVAGSLAPLFGSYEPDAFDPALAPGMYEPIVEAQAPFVDQWLIETMSSVAEATAAVEAIERLGRRDQPIWLAFCLPDVTDDAELTLRSGETIAQLVAAFATDGGSRVAAFLVNCSTPESIDAALPVLRLAVPDHLPIGAYANTFVPQDLAIPANAGISTQRSELTPDVYAHTADGWIERGATIVGGCCGIFPDHIAELAARYGAQPTTDGLSV